MLRIFPFVLTPVGAQRTETFFPRPVPGRPEPLTQISISITHSLPLSAPFHILMPRFFVRDLSDAEAAALGLPPVPPGMCCWSKIAPFTYVISPFAPPVNPPSSSSH